MIANDVLSAAQDVLREVSGDFWSLADLLGYLNEAQRSIAQLAPDAATVTAAHELVSGIRQPLPGDSMGLVDVIRNLGLTHIDYGPMISAVDMRDLGRVDREWQTRRARFVEHYMYDPREPSVFYVYPGQSFAIGRVELRYVRRPSELISDQSVLALADEHRASLIDYVLYRAYGKDPKAELTQRAAGHYQQFMRAVVGNDAGSARTTAGVLDARGELR